MPATTHFLTRLKTDPAWARDVLAASYSDARLRWQRRWREGKHPSWIHPKNSVPLAFEYALLHLPGSTEPDDVHTAIQFLIDDFITQHLADAAPYTPVRLDRGAKRRRRSTVRNLELGRAAATPTNVWASLRDTQEAAELRDTITRHERHEHIIGRIRNQNLRRGLVMLLEEFSLKEIREATNLRGPDLQKGFEKWLLITGLAA